MRRLFWVMVFWTTGLFAERVIQVKPGVQMKVYTEEKIQELYDASAQTIVELVKKHPDALILLPTGSTPEKLYKNLVEIFHKDSALDFSKATFFNLDEYVELPPHHPLSYTFYMQHHLYGPLTKIDAKRAPLATQTHVPGILGKESPQERANAYQKALEEAVEKNPRKCIDLAILGVGSAFPVKTDGKWEMHGGHIAFNEPGFDPELTTHVVELTEHTRKDTGFRFTSFNQFILSHPKFWKKHLQETSVPKLAISIGIKTILGAKELMVLATGESKAPILEKIFATQNPTSDIPASYLLKHAQSTWYLDEFAGIHLPKNLRPWVGANEFKEAWVDLAIEDLLQEAKEPIGEITVEQLECLQISSELAKKWLKAFQKRKAILVESLQSKTTTNLPPPEDSAFILSPHPDDDVICMAATLKKMLDRGNKVHVAYAVSGENAVRPSGKIFTAYQHHTARSVKHFLQKRKDRENFLKILVREHEAKQATKVLGLPASNLHFLSSEYYYRRGIPSVDSLTLRDILAMKKLLLKLKPKHIFFTAENDPHGAHGLSTKLMQIALRDIMKKKLWEDIDKVKFYGYRGAYNEWSMLLAPKLMVVPFNNKMRDLKTESIKQHASQLNPMFPSFDNREFFERARERNAKSGKDFAFLQGLQPKEAKTENAEVFRVYGFDEFVNGSF